MCLLIWKGILAQYLRNYYLWGTALMEKQIGGTETKSLKSKTKFVEWMHSRSSVLTLTECLLIKWEWSSVPEINTSPRFFPQRVWRRGWTSRRHCHTRNVKASLQHFNGLTDPSSPALYGEKLGKSQRPCTGKWGQLVTMWWWWGGGGVPERERKHEKAKRKTEDRKSSQETFNTRNASHCCNISPLQFPQTFRKVLRE